MLDSWGGSIENNYLIVHIHDIHENTYKLDYYHRSCDMLDNIHDCNVSTYKLDIAMIINSQNIVLNVYFGWKCFNLFT